MSAYIDALKHSFDTSGKTTVAEFWKFMGLHIVLIFVAGLIDSLFGPVMAPGQFIGAIGGIYILLTLPAVICATIRRMRDAAYSPWWVLLMLLPGFGAFIVMLMTFRGSR